MRWGVVVVVALATALAGCGLFGKRKPPAPVSAEAGASQKGIASWYGPGFHGRRTANGEIYNQFAMTAAHQTLPADTRVRVTNLTNGRSCVVRINDRGPFVDDRIIDLSYAAAREIEMIGPGTAPVRLEVLAPGWIEPVPPVQVAEAAPPPRVVPVAVSAAAPVDPPRTAPSGAAASIELPPAARSRAAVAPPPPSRYAVQVAAFSDYERARRTQRLLEQQGAAARLGLVEEAGIRYYRLRLGPFMRQDDAARTAQRINALGYPALIVADGASWQ